jgi:hypothetical protein
MKAIDALLALLECVNACRDTAVLVNDEDLLQWPKAATKAMKSQKLIVKARSATSALCPGCENNCVMPVHNLPSTAGPQASFILCDKRDDINRVPLPVAKLIQWQCSTDLVCRFIAFSLGLRSSSRQTDSTVRREIGIVCGDKRSQMLCLEASDTLMLVAGSSRVPLAECIEFREGAYSIDAVQIRRLADLATTADDRYTPSNARREARKLDTKATHENWRKEYRKLRREKPGMSDVWYSKKIAKMDIAQGRDAETIRKQMKK